MKRPGNLLKYRYQGLRGRLVQPAFWALCFLGPALDLFRVDMIHQQLIFLRHSYSFSFEHLIWLPVGFYGGVILIGVVSAIWGRLFCGWSCPHNTLTEWTTVFRAMAGRVEKPRRLKLLIRNHPFLAGWLSLASPFLAAMLTGLLSLLLSFYVVPPEWVLAQYASGHPHIALVYGNALFLLIGLFLLYAGTDFCRTCCPYGLAQSISAYHEGGRWRPMEIRFTGDVESQCKTCTGCQSVCPVDIDPRDATLKGGLKVGQFDGCFNCGECIDACKFIHSFKKKPGLLSFRPPGFRGGKTVVVSGEAESVG